MKSLYIYIIFCILLLACGNKQEATNTPSAKEDSTQELTLTAEQVQKANLQMHSITMQQLSSVIKVTGQIDVPPQNLVSVSMPLGGYLQSTHLLPGMHVNKGEVIAVLEDQQYIQLQQDYLTAKAKLELYKAEYKRQQQLNETKASSDKQLEQAKADMLTTSIQCQALAEKLKLIHINPTTLTENTITKNVRLYAPIDGFVSKVNVNVGKYITPSDVLFELVNPNDIHLNLKVFEKDLIHLALGQKVIAYTNSNPEKKYECEIILISKDISSNRTADVHCHFEAYDKKLIPGMYMNADVEVDAIATAAIQESAIVHFDGADYVFIANSNNKFTMVPVKTGVKEKGFIQILNTNVFEGKSIVTQGAYTLLMALKNKAEEG
ncbi:MAG: efflux RND transporter periplasmic adaptor subunit [Chitinophagaceae bacterium]